MGNLKKIGIEGMRCIDFYLSNLKFYGVLRCAASEIVNAVRGDKGNELRAQKPRPSKQQMDHNVCIYTFFIKPTTVCRDLASTHAACCLCHRERSELYRLCHRERSELYRLSLMQSSSTLTIHFHFCSFYRPNKGARFERSIFNIA